MQVSQLRSDRPGQRVLVRWGYEQLRLSAWNADPRTAQLVPAPESPAPSADAVRHALRVAAGHGFSAVYTSALVAREQRGFRTAGFVPHERLHLLSRGLDRLPERPPVPLRRGRRTDRAAAALVDALAFEHFWHLDEEGLIEALAATPASRLAVSTSPTGEVIGYGIAGRAGRRGYLQRLAVHPDWRRHGVGAALVIDALRWMRRWSGTTVFVNTQVRNEPALQLYLHLGFRLEPGGLMVLRRSLVDLS